MKVTVDSEKQLVIVEDAPGQDRALPLHSPESFEILSRLWVKTGWALKYSYSFTWLGRPVIQLPEDLVRIQEVVFRVQPDVLIETGVAHGGSLVFYATLFRAMGRGRVIGVDVEIRPHNLSKINAHPLADLITLHEGSSIEPAVVKRVANGLRPTDRVMVVLDSNHSRRHVLEELRAYGDLVTPGSYLVVADGVMQDLLDVPGGRPEWRDDNPREAVRDFLASTKQFILEDPPFAFNEGKVTQRVTYWPDAYLRRLPD
jgi:cephalosporin hydroxylase